MSVPEFQLLGYWMPTDAYPAPVVPVGKLRAELVAVYLGADGPETVAIDGGARWLPLEPWHSTDFENFDYTRERLFAFGRKVVVRIPFSEEAEFYSILLRNPFFSADDYFVRLSLAEIAEDRGLLGRELANCADHLTRNEPDVVDAWYAAARSSIAALRWDAGPLPEAWYDLPVPDPERRLPVSVVTPGDPSDFPVAARIKAQFGSAEAIVEGALYDSFGRENISASVGPLESVKRVWQAEAVVLLGQERTGDGTYIRVFDHGASPALEELLKTLECAEGLGESEAFIPPAYSLFERVRTFRIPESLPAASRLAEPSRTLTSKVAGAKSNCRTVSEAAWQQARIALIFYFSRRRHIDYPEDLAHNALLALWGRPDFEFEKEDDFLRVCYAFAARVAQSGLREARKHKANELPRELASREHRTRGLEPAELATFLDEVLKTMKTQLAGTDRQLLLASVGAANQGAHTSFSGSANNLRVRLHRARKKLSKLTGWRKGGK